MPQITSLTGKSPLERLESSLQTYNDQYSQSRQADLGYFGGVGDELINRAKERKTEELRKNIYDRIFNPQPQPINNGIGGTPFNPNQPSGVMPAKPPTTENIQEGAKRGIYELLLNNDIKGAEALSKVLPKEDTNVTDFETYKSGYVKDHPNASGVEVVNNWNLSKLGQAQGLQNIKTDSQQKLEEFKSRFKNPNDWQTYNKAAKAEWDVTPALQAKYKSSEDYAIAKHSADKMKEIAAGVQGKIAVKETPPAKEHDVPFSKQLQIASDKAVKIGNALTSFDSGKLMVSGTEKNPQYYDPTKDKWRRDQIAKDLEQAQKDVEEIQKVAKWGTDKTPQTDIPQPSADKFTVGKTYKDASGNVAKYLGDGKWENSK